MMILIQMPTMASHSHSSFYNNSTAVPKSKCTWYTLSHYVTPDSILYDVILGFFIT